MRKYLILLVLALVTYSILLLALSQLDIVMEWIYKYKLIACVLLSLIGVPLLEWAKSIDNNLKKKHEIGKNKPR